MEEIELLSKSIGLVNYFVVYDGKRTFSVKKYENTTNNQLLDFKSSQIDQDLIYQYIFLIELLN